MTVANMLNEGVLNESSEVARKGAMLLHHAKDMSYIPQKIFGGLGKVMVKHPDAFQTAETLGHGAAAYGVVAGTHSLMNKNSSEAAMAAEHVLGGVNKKVKDFGTKLMANKEKDTLLHGIGEKAYKYPGLIGWGGTLAAGAAGAAAIHGLSKSSGEGLPSHPWRYAAYHGSYIAAADLLASRISDKLKAKETTFPDQSHGVTSTMHTFPKTAEELKQAILQKAADFNDNPSVMPYLAGGAVIGGAAGEAATRALVAHRATAIGAAKTHNRGQLRMAARSVRSHRQGARAELVELAQDYQSGLAKHTTAADIRLHGSAYEANKSLIRAKTQEAIQKVRTELGKGVAHVPTEFSRTFRYGVPAAAAATGALLAMNMYPGSN